MDKCSSCTQMKKENTAVRKALMETNQNYVEVVNENLALRSGSCYVRYDRGVLRDVMIHHQRMSTGACHCGWFAWGASFADHVLTLYEIEIGLIDGRIECLNL